MSDDAIDPRGALIESKMNIERAATIGVALGGIDLRDMAQVLEFAKNMAKSEAMVPAFCRNQIWTCFAICMQALEWRMSPFSLARMAYEVENARTKERTVAYMSQVHHAVLESRGVLKERLRLEYEGEGDETVCVVSGTFKNETEPRKWRSPPLGARRPKPQQRHNRQTGEAYETTAGSPLWQVKPLVQLFYDTSRDWMRIYCPDVIMGIYGADEMADAGFEPTTAPPGGAAPDDGGLTTRLTTSALARAGFSADQAAAAVDAAMAARDNQGGQLDSLSVAQEADGAGPATAPASSATEAPPPAPPDPDVGEHASEPAPTGDEPAAPGTETAEGRPRASRARRSGHGGQALRGADGGDYLV